MFEDNENSHENSNDGLYELQLSSDSSMEISPGQQHEDLDSTASTENDPNYDHDALEYGEPIAPNVAAINVPDVNNMEVENGSSDSSDGTRRNSEHPRHVPQMDGNATFSSESSASASAGDNDDGSDNESVESDASFFGEDDFIPGVDDASEDIMRDHYSEVTPQEFETNDPEYIANFSDDTSNYRSNDDQSDESTDNVRQCMTYSAFHSGDICDVISFPGRT